MYCAFNIGPGFSQSMAQSILIASKYQRANNMLKHGSFSNQHTMGAQMGANVLAI